MLYLISIKALRQKVIFKAIGIYKSLPQKVRFSLIAVIRPFQQAVLYQKRNLLTLLCQFAGSRSDRFL
ncbi:hypothetical protein EBO33_23645 [[Curtobacterium] plantarum]|nr:hypothetical protein EBO33_23645 [[Curtobacterium] plantarum]